MEQTLKDAIRNANSDIGTCLTVPEFQFKKKRVQFLRLLNSDSYSTTDLSADQTRHVTDTVLKQQDERSTLAVLETFAKDDKRIISRMRGIFRPSTGEEGLWQSASKSASTISDSQFLSELKAVPVDHFLHEAAIDVEGTAYALLTKQVDTVVSRVVRQIILMQKKECDKQVRREIDIEAAREAQIPWSNFVRLVKNKSKQRSTSYVSCGVWDGPRT